VFTPAEALVCQLVVPLTRKRPGLRAGVFTVCMARLSVRIRSRLFDSILAQELGYFDCTKTGARGAPAALARG